MSDMKGAIRFSNGEVVHFNKHNYKDVIGGLTDSQRHQLVKILLERLGPKPDNEFGVDDDIYRVWLDLSHRDDIKRGGGSKNGESSPKRKGSKKMTRKWADKGEAEKNITWLIRLGFRRRWNNEVGYIYRHPSVGEVPLDWVYQLDHEFFQVKIKELMESEHQGSFKLG